MTALRTRPSQLSGYVGGVCVMMAGMGVLATRAQQGIRPSDARLSPFRNVSVDHLPARTFGPERWWSPARIAGFWKASFCYCYSFYWYVACIYFVIGACMVDYIHLICVFKWEKFFSFFLSLFVLLFIVLFTRCHLLHFLLLHFHVCLPLFFVSVVLLFSHFTLLVLSHILLSPVSSSLYHHVFRLFSLSFPHILSIIVLSSDFFLPFPFFLVATSSLPASFSFLERPFLYSLSPR